MVGLVGGGTGRRFAALVRRRRWPRVSLGPAKAAARRVCHSPSSDVDPRNFAVQALTRPERHRRQWATAVVFAAGFSAPDGPRRFLSLFNVPPTSVVQQRHPS